MGRAKRPSASISLTGFDQAFGSRRGSGSFPEGIFSDSPEKHEKQVLMAMENNDYLTAYNALKGGGAAITTNPVAIRIANGLADKLTQMSLEGHAGDARTLLGELGVSFRHTDQVIRDSETRMVHINDGETSDWRSDHSRWKARCGHTAEQWNITARGEWSSSPQLHCPDCVAAPAGDGIKVEVDEVFTEGEESYPLFPGRWDEKIAERTRAHMPKAIADSFDKMTGDYHIYTVHNAVYPAYNKAFLETLQEYCADGHGYEMLKEMIPEKEFEPMVKELQQRYPGQDIKPMFDDVLSPFDWKRRLQDSKGYWPGAPSGEENVLPAFKVPEIILERLKG